MNTEGGSARAISGQRVVVAMFVFGSLATATLWAYWHYHMMPFMPLQDALVEQFGKDSAPRVEGGQRKMHRHSTRMLRVVLRVPFNPESESPEIARELERYLTTVRDTAADILDLTQYDTLELHLFEEQQEQTWPQITLRRNLQTWEPVNEDGSPVSDSAADP